MSGPLLSIDAMKADGRDASGRFTRGNLAAFKHGQSAGLDARPSLAPLHQDRIEAITRDLGGPAELTHLERAHVREVARLELVVEALGNDLIERGALTGKGRQRAALGAYLMSLDRLTRLSTTIGLQRRPRPALTLEQAMRGEA